VGITLAKKPGEQVAEGEPLATLHLREGQAEGALVERVRGAFSVGDAAPTARPLVVGRVE
jgi:thymidine phosphorylase